MNRKIFIASVSLISGLAMLLGGTAIADQCVGEYAVDDSTLGLWHFNDGIGTAALDDSGNGYDGIFEGNPLPTWDTGRFGSGVHLTREGDNGVKLGALTALAAGYTLEMYFKWDYAYVAELGYLFSIDDAAFARMYLVEHGAMPATYQIQYSVRRGDGAWPTINTPADNTLDTNWHHLAFTRSWDGVTTGYAVYIDGKLAASGSFAGGFWDPHFDAYLGSAGYPNSVGGAIDEVRFSNVVRKSFQNDWGHLKGDINQDCYVNLQDVALLAADWLK